MRSAQRDRVWVSLLVRSSTLRTCSTLGAIKLRLHGRLLDYIDDVLALQRRSEERSAATAR
jgi:hypothetical protein